MNDLAARLIDMTYFAQYLSLLLGLICLFYYATRIVA